MMRIITGKARGVRLDTLAGEETRPTAERIKEAIFSSIQFDLEGKRFLDLFAGSGQMGLEAISRGAQQAIMVDDSAQAVDIIKNNAKKSKLFDQCRISNVNYAEFLRGISGKETFDYIYIDPPFAKDLWADVLKRVYRAQILAANTVLFCESENDDYLKKWKELDEYYTVIKQNRYGRMLVTVLMPKENIEK